MFAPPKADTREPVSICTYLVTPSLSDRFRRMRSIFMIWLDNGRIKSNRLVVCHVHKSIERYYIGKRKQRSDWYS